MGLDKVKKHSEHTLNFWKTGARGWAPKNASIKLEVAKIDWLLDLTDCLTIWNDRSIKMTEGELILAYANLGALVEGWLKLFYCVYFIDYCKKPQKDRKGCMIEPNNLNFEKLKQFSRDILWSTNDNWDKWVTKIQQRRNTIHAFNDKKIGTPVEYIEDIDTFEDFIELIDQHFPYPDDGLYRFRG